MLLSVVSMSSSFTSSQAFWCFLYCICTPWCDTSDLSLSVHSCLLPALHMQLLQQLQRLRSAAYAASPTSPTSTGTGGLLSGGSGHSDDAAACVLTREGPCTNSFSAVLEEARLDVEGMACELLALGYMVQVRDGAQQQERGKTPRSCLQNLRHRYIVCLGVRNAADGEPSYLPEPLVVEPRFREQFTIAHPTPDYEALLQVGSSARLGRLRAGCELTGQGSRAWGVRCVHRCGMRHSMASLTHSAGCPCCCACY